eukprot:scaffold256867_cov26-Prasinocladus_malaysianus.AAC.1
MLAARLGPRRDLDLRLAASEAVSDASVPGGEGPLSLPTADRRLRLSCSALSRSSSRLCGCCGC